MKSSFLFVSILSLALYFRIAPIAANAQQPHHDEKIWVVAGSVLNARICPHIQCPVVHRLRKGDKVVVYEQKRGWARVGDYFDAHESRIKSAKAKAIMLKADRGARWVSLRYLVPYDIKKEIVKAKQGAHLDARKGHGHDDFAHPKMDTKFFDARIKGIPKAGQYGLTHKDVVLIRTYAHGLIEKGVCKGVDYGGRSVWTRGYFVHCYGERRPRLFTAADVKFAVKKF